MSTAEQRRRGTPVAVGDEFEWLHRVSMDHYPEGYGPAKGTVLSVTTGKLGSAVYEVEYIQEPGTARKPYKIEIIQRGPRDFSSQLGIYKIKLARKTYAFDYCWDASTC